MPVPRKGKIFGDNLGACGATVCEVYRIHRTFGYRYGSLHGSHRSIGGAGMKESCYDRGGVFWVVFFHEILLEIVVEISYGCSNALAPDE